MGVYNPKKKMPTSCYMCWDSLYCEYKIKNPVKMAQGRADDCPLIEIDLVRCGECEYWTGYCTNKIWQSPTDDYLPQTYADDFCSYGERRADDQLKR